MSVTWVNVLLTGGKPVAYIHTTEGLLIDDIPLSPLLLKTLCTDRNNRVAEGIGYIVPTPWGWVWDNVTGVGKLPEPPKRSEILQDIIVATDVVPLYHLSLLERR